MKRTLKGLIALLLMFAMILSIIPSILAEEPAQDEQKDTGATPVETPVTEGNSQQELPTEEPKNVEESPATEATEATQNQNEPAEEEIEDGDYELPIESTFSMFKIASQTCTVKNNVVSVKLCTEKLTYDKIYLGSKDDIVNETMDSSKVIQGQLNSDGTGYIFTFVLPKTYMGKSVDFAPGKPDGTWYTKNQYQLKIPATMDKIVEDGEYELPIESTFSMFKITSQSCTVSNNVITVKIGTEKLTYDKIYLGSKDDIVNETMDSSKVIQGQLNTEGTGYNFTFVLAKSYMGKSIDFAPGKPDGTWYTKNQYQLTIPATMSKVEPEEPEATETPTETEAPEEPEEPIEPETKLENGDYNVSATTDSAMFKIVNTVINAKDGKYTATITLSGTGYDKLFLGTAEDALTNTAGQISYEVDDDGKYTFVLNDVKLDTDIAVSAHSVKKDIWYDRTVNFAGSSAQKVEEKVEDGKYNVSVSSDSSMFKIVSAVLTSSNGKYNAVITLSGTGYDMLYKGSAEAAANANESEKISFVEDEDGKYTFAINDIALDTDIAIAAHSVKKDLWYDRTLVFSKESLEKIAEETDPTETEPETPEEPVVPEKTSDKDTSGSTKKINSKTGLKDGTYTPDKFTYSGGTGKVVITCEEVVVKNGKATATITFSSDKFEYVKANGRTYYTTKVGGKAVVSIPVQLNKNNKIIGMTTAMTTAHEVSYSLYIYIEGATAKDTLEGQQYIEGLLYQGTDSNSNATKYFLHRFEKEYILLEVMNLFQYLIVPDGMEVPEGMDKQIIPILQPTEKTLIVSNETLEYLLSTEIESIRAAASIRLGEVNDENLVSVGTLEDLDYAALLMSGCKLVVLPYTFADTRVSGIITSEGAEITVEELDDETAEQYKTIVDGLNELGITVFIDCSAMEETEEGKLEWLRIYGVLFNCEKEMNVFFETELSKLVESQG